LEGIHWSFFWPSPPPPPNPPSKKNKGVVAKEWNKLDKVR
jgi:hypothetical protein